MSLMNFIDMFMGNFHWAYISSFTQYDEDGYPLEENFDDYDTEDGDFGIEEDEWE